MIVNKIMAPEQPITGGYLVVCVMAISWRISDPGSEITAAAV